MNIYNLFKKEKYTNGYVLSIGGIVSRYRKTDQISDGKEVFSAEFMDIVTFNLFSEDEAKEWIVLKYHNVMQKLLVMEMHRPFEV